MIPGIQLKDNKKVIPSTPEPVEWTFMSFVTGRGTVVSETWDIPKTFEAELSFAEMLNNNRKISDHLQWPSFRHRMQHEAGKCGILELEFKADNRPYRVLVKLKGRKCMILLCVCYHKGSNWTPSNALKVAVERAKAIEKGTAKTNVIPRRDHM